MTNRAAILIALLMDLLAAPYFYEGGSAAMNKQWSKAITAYLIGFVPAVISLLVFGALWTPLRTSWGIALIRWMQPLNDVRWIVIILLASLLWLSGREGIE